MDERLYRELGDYLLKQLAEKTTTWLARECGVSREAVSQWISGKTRPRWRKVPDVAKALEVSSAEILRLGHYEEDEERLYDVRDSVPAEDVWRAKEDVGNFYCIRIEGNAQRTVEMVNEWLPWLESKKRAARGTSAFQELLKFHAEALYQKGESYTELLTFNEMGDRALSVARAMEVLISESEDDSIAHFIDRLVAYRFGALWYHNKSAVRSIEAYNKALIDLHTSEYDDRALESLRTIALCHAYRNDIDNDDKCREIIRLRDRILTLIDTPKFSDEMVCEVLEGIGRAEGQVGLPTAYKWVEQAAAIISNKKLMTPFRSVQLLRSEIDIAKRDPAQKAFVLGCAAQGLQLATMFGYRRYTEMFEEVINYPTG